MGITHWLEKLSRDGWKVEILPHVPNSDFAFVVEATKGDKRVSAYDEYTPANAIKMVAEKIYDEGAA